MSKLNIIEITRKELDEGIPRNHVLIEADLSNEGLKTKGGIIIGFLDDTTWEGDHEAHNADMCVNYGKVYATPSELYFNEDDENSMPWETEMELAQDDLVWFSIMESYNAVTFLCEDTYYKLIPYESIYAVKRECWRDKWKGEKYTKIFTLNGYVLCKPIKHKVKVKPTYDKVTKQFGSHYEERVDPTRGIISFTGTPNISYKQDSYVDHQDLKEGDEVLFAPRTPILYLERSLQYATFDKEQLHLVIPRRKIVAVLKRR